MKSLDTFTKRIVVFAAAISMILLSLSVFIYTTQQVIAQPIQPNTTKNQTVVGLGVDAEFVYYAVKVSVPNPVIGFPPTNKYYLTKASKKEAGIKPDYLGKGALAMFDE